MNYNNYNIRKKQVLSILSYTYPYTAKEISDLCPVSLSCICALLKRYTKIGLIKRKKENNKFLYEITQKGLDRLNYLINLKEEQDELLVREPVKILKS